MLLAHLNAVAHIERARLTSMSQPVRWATHAHSKSRFGSAVALSPSPVHGSRTYIPASDTSRTAPIEESGSVRQPDQKVQVASGILRQVAVRKLTEQLGDEATRRVSIPLSELLYMIKAAGVTSDDVAAMDLAHSLHACGIVIMHEERVYLNAEEVRNVF
jgi:hypothetical protein